MALFDTTAFRVTEEGLGILWQKQQVLSQNIANADTPGYNCKYLNFYGVLQDKMSNSSLLSSNTTKGATKELHLASSIVEDNITNQQPDGNNVDNDTQQAELAKTQLQYEALINHMNGEFARLRSAMKT